MHNIWRAVRGARVCTQSEWLCAVCCVGVPQPLIRGNWGATRCTCEGDLWGIGRVGRPAAHRVSRVLDGEQCSIGAVCVTVTGTARRTGAGSRPGRPRDGLRATCSTNTSLSGMPMSMSRLYLVISTIHTNLHVHTLLLVLLVSAIPAPVSYAPPPRGKVVSLRSIFSG